MRRESRRIDARCELLRPHLKSLLAGAVAPQPATQTRRPEHGHKVIDIGVVPKGPEDSSGGCFGSYLIAEFYLPSRSFFILDHKLRIRAGRTFLDKGEVFSRPLREAARTIKQISRRDLCGRLPELPDGCAGSLFRYAFLCACCFPLIAAPKLKHLGY